MHRRRWMRGRRHDGESSEEDERTLERQRRMLILGKQKREKGSFPVYAPRPHFLSLLPVTSRQKAPSPLSHSLSLSHTHTSLLSQPTTN